MNVVIAVVVSAVAGGPLSRLLIFSLLVSSIRLSLRIVCSFECELEMTSLRLEVEGILKVMVRRLAASVFADAKVDAFGFADDRFGSPC